MSQETITGTSEFEGAMVVFDDMLDHNQKTNESLLTPKRS